ncbi:DNA recombination protein RecF [Burkholderiales bacterium 8X]|nr:DNA recombination protein RecF [Burkholderiales bacterium 8X]
MRFDRSALRPSIAGTWAKVATNIVSAWLCGSLLIAVSGCTTPAGVSRNSLQPVEHIDKTGMAFVQIPAGGFLMGSVEDVQTLARDFPQYDTSRFEKLGDEGPVHRVRITRPFWMGRHEVTVAEFGRFVAATGYVPESIADGTGGYGFNPRYDPATSPRGDAFEGRDPRYSWRNPGFAQGPDHPVVNVTFADATAMARWLSGIEGVTYRLPTEAEWEYAARAGSRTRFNTGDDPKSLRGSANIFHRDSAVNWPQWQVYAMAEGDGHPFTSPVESFAPNAFGLYDMHGNAWEWCSDWHDDAYYAISPVDDPTGPPQGSVKVRRGGSWHTWAFYARSAFRNWNTPETRYPLLGFRLVREAAADKW